MARLQRGPRKIARRFCSRCASSAGEREHGHAANVASDVPNVAPPELSRQLNASTGLAASPLHSEKRWQEAIRSVTAVRRIGFGRSRYGAAGSDLREVAFMKWSRIFFVASMGVALAAACGGSSSQNTGNGDGGGGSSSSGAAGGSSSGSSSGGSSGGLVTEGGAIVPTGIQCGMLNGQPAYCPGAEVCCAVTTPPPADAGRGGGFGGATTNTCVAGPSACQAGGVVTACTGSLQCSGKVCCLEPGDAGAMGGFGGGGGSALCESACSANGTQICAATTDCPTGQMCMGRGGGRMACVTPPCTGPASCAAGQMCCTGMGRGGGGNMCQATCPMGSMQVCAATADCPSGQTCNMAGGGTMTCGAPACTAGSCGAGMVCCAGRGGAVDNCQATGAAGCIAICLTNTDCATGQMCMAAGGGGMTCVTPPCTHGSCAAGEICCTGGATGATCQATDAGTCPMGRVVCATATDCPVAGDVCNAGGGGGMILSCRPPPPEGGAMMTMPMDAGGGG